jgi:hypothetical protein
MIHRTRAARSDDTWTHFTPTIRPELLDELLKSTKKPDDIFGPEGLLHRLAKLEPEGIEVPRPRFARRDGDVARLHGGLSQRARGVARNGPAVT